MKSEITNNETLKNNEFLKITNQPNGNLYEYIKLSHIGGVVISKTGIGIFPDNLRVNPANGREALFVLDISHFDDEKEGIAAYNELRGLLINYIESKK